MPAGTPDAAPPAGYLAAIRSREADLTASEAKVAQTVLDHPGEVIRMSITELAERAEVGVATVSRFCQRLGLRGFHELKIEIAHELVPGTVTTTPLVAAGGDYPTWAGSAAGRTIAMIETTMRQFDADAFRQAVDLLVKARRIDFYGLASSGLTAMDAQLRFLTLGKTCNAYVDSHVQAMAAAVLGPEDVAVAISYSGSTKDMVANLSTARKRRARTIAITGAPRSPLAEIADVVLVAGSDETMLVSNLFNKIGQLFVVELLVEGCAREMGQQAHRTSKLISEAVADKIY
ncbi:MurR/RpiR family transcriptional regulator [Microbispora sp. CA-102843]|uniref:MurR/RpiR family transcriptional regulator n=1 Tax=Microbispora sp. CA-102843 TaxID=3239952 RepID=UPI003D8A2D52